MEHLSRRTTDNIDLLIIAAEPTKVGIVTAKRIVELTKSLPISIGETGIIWNKSDEAIPTDIEGVSVLGSVPYDEAVLENATEGNTVFDLQEDSAALTAVRNILYQKFNIEKINTEVS